MATFPLIFPSLSRQPSMDTSKKTEDDTIRDPMESGNVATRPRFTRARRTWPFNVRNLVAEDIRALDEFFMSNAYAARGGNSFLFPNLLPNWSFEFPALDASEVVFGWSVAASGAPQESIGVSTVTVQDGTQAISFATVAGQIVPANTTVTGQLNCDWAVPCKPGEVYVFTGQAHPIHGTIVSGVLAAQVNVSFFDANSNALSTLTGTGVNIYSLPQSYGYQFTVPAGAVSFSVALVATLTNSTGVGYALDGSASVVWDCVGCALLTPLTPYGRMVGSQPLGCLVRFASLPEIADIGWGNGVKVYGAKLELQEV
jgi:hypothetical protein